MASLAYLTKDGMIKIFSRGNEMMVRRSPPFHSPVFSGQQLRSLDSMI